MRVHLVTGASTGIGRAVAVALARLGDRVYGSVRSDGDAAAIDAAGVVPVRLDVTDEAGVVAGVDAVLTEAGRLDGLVNNAGIALGRPVEALETEDLRHLLDVNVLGVHRVTHAALPALVAARGRVVNVSSISGRIGLPLFAAYAASKFALEGYSDALRREVAAAGVHVALVEPGQVRTPIWDKSVPPEGEIAALPARYHHLARTLRDRALRGAEHGLDPTVVADAVVHALTAPRPRIRYAMPRADRVVGRLLPALPDRLADRLVLRRIGG